jgi:transposase
MKLEKLTLPSVPEIESLEPSALVCLAKEWRERIEYYQGLLFRANKKQFGSSSERSPKVDDSLTLMAESDVTPGTPKTPKPRSDTTKQLSERYPDAPIRIEPVGFSEPPCCPQCGKAMQDSGMTEDSEYLTTEPKEYIIVRQKRQKHRCGKCHSSIVTAASPARVIPGGSYSDEMIIDATLSKFCDLIPMERYCQMAARRGLLGLPPHSLITASRKLAVFLDGVYKRLKAETLNTKVLLADETPHRMLEGDLKKKWYLWGFSSQESCFFECHNTRSGDVSTAVLLESVCEFLLTDVYSGYGKSIRLANEIRAKKNLTAIIPAYCNSHARRKFKDRDSAEVCEDAEWMVERYKEIYKLNKESKDQTPEVIMEKRAEMKPIFEAMREEALKKINSYSSKSQMADGYNYFIENYEGLTRFLDNHLIPIDNNHSERILRSHVVGRKTWYGTHSRRSAETAAVHFSIVESCKMIGINPREFYLDAVQRIHAKLDPLTPWEYKQQRTSNTS